MTPSRRTFLTGLLASPALMRLGPAFASEGRALTMPAIDEGTVTAGALSFDLGLQSGEMEFLAGRATPTIGINGPYLGPILRARAGEALSLRVRNGLEEASSLHWHGLHLPAAMDGGPHQPIAPGASWTAEFPLKQKAGTFWFHSHQHGRTAAQVWSGLAGVIRVEDEEEGALPLPRTHGEDDFTLVLQDRRFGADGAMTYAPDMHDLMAGKVGDVMLVNGQVGAHLPVAAPLARLRVLNGANGSIYRLHFAGDVPFVQIASDGGLLEAPVMLTEALVAPGERVELLVDLSAGAPLMLRAEVFGAEAPFAGSNGVRDVIEIRPDRARSAPPALPDRLASLPPVPAATGATRTFKLGMTGEGLMGTPVIDGIPFDHGRIDFTVPLGAVETWIFENTSQMLHPMHVHDVQFRIVSRNGQPPAPREAGLKDVVLTQPGERVELRMEFTDYADPVSPYMMHCHILEHEDQGMMKQFTVV
ncbi:multicopper oxidase domain-containing protein [Frigidibacter sp. RF13]|uniref:multicopper oxidase family protein n=1 Tax=Frigidibacter sp. RF13 TaxID=2997340 RepID=UPI002271DF38|nr:multicopper oxidase domain-containing protein [Frigidibacter sp. RF13]MCY1126163.1 multicopper oxidase domain-containing protein [Frigidibacter sp. RF13]